MERDAIEEKLKEVFTEVFPYVSESGFKIDQPRSEYEDWDSLNHMQVVSNIESAFDITFELDEVVEINSPSDFIKLIQDKHSEK